MNAWPRRILIAGLLLWLTACTTAGTPTEPPRIAYGEDVCDECSMIIAEERFAAAYVTVDGKSRRFDDIGGMLNYDREHGEDVAVYWVHDINSHTWLDAADAFFVVESGLVTPMGHGVVACADEMTAEAVAYGTDEARILGFAELRQLWNQSTMAGQMDHDH